MTQRDTRELREHTPRRDIQGLRAVAVLIVVAFHAGLPLPGGFVGVDVFFVISGFVITGMLMRQLAAEGTIRMGTFYARRIKRLVPALALVLLVTLGLTFLLGSPFDSQQTMTAATAIGAILMFANGVIFLRSGDYFATPPTNNPLLNTWSLSVEEQFYLVFPAMLLALWWWSRRSRSPSLIIPLGIGVGVAASFVLSVSMSFGLLSGPLTDPEWFAFYSSPTRAWEFGVGALAYLLVARSRSLFTGWSATATWWVGLGGVVLSCFVITEQSVFPGWVVLLPVISTALLLISGAAAPAGAGFLASRPAVALGDASYSWYLWHWPLIAFSVMVLPTFTWAPLAAAILSLGLAAATLRYVENPIRFATLRGRAVVGIAAVAVGSVVLTSAVLIVGARTGWMNPNVQQMIAQVSPGHRWLDGCNSSNPVNERGNQCLWGGDPSAPPVYLLGDSMAGALGEGLDLAGQQLGRPVMVGTKGACPFIDADLYVDGRWDEGCGTAVQGSLTWLESQPPADVLISSTLGYLVIDGVGLSEPGTDTPVFSPREKQDLYLQALGRAVSRLSAAGHRVTVALPPPGFPQTVMAYEAWRPSQCATYRALTNIDSCGAERSEADVIGETKALFSAVSQVVRDSGGAVWDPRAQLCSDGVCSVKSGSQWRYLDGSHISVPMSEDLAPALNELVDGSRSVSLG